MSTTGFRTDAPFATGSSDAGNAHSGERSSPNIQAATSGEQPSPDIQAVMGALRSFSNEVTVARLARSLNVSYSTLARCKNGYWPPSVTFNALRSVFDQYKDEFFEGDGRLLAVAALEYLRSHDLRTTTLEAAYDTRGYEGFINALLLQAAETTRKQNAAQGEEVQGLTATARPSVRAVGLDQAQPSPLHKAAPYLPLVLVVGIGLFQAPVESMIGWMLGHPVAFLVLSLAIALASPAAGLFIDSPIAWVRAQQREGRQDFTWQSFCLVAKYGSSKTIVPGEGRYDPSRGHLVYGTLCNVLGALCAISLLFALRTFPGFADYVASHSWVEYLKCCVAVGFVIAYHHAHTHQSLPRRTSFGPGFNPDNYRYSRMHVWANTVHLVWVISIACALALCMIGYSVAHLQENPLPLAVLWPFAQTALFLAYANTSPFARKSLAPTVGSFAPGMVGMSAAMAVLAVACYQPSWQNAVALAAYGACAAFALFWQHELRAQEAGIEWVQRGRTTRAYGTGMVAALLVMLLAGLLTSSLV